MGGSPENVRHMRQIGQLCVDAGLRVMEAAGWTDRGRTWGVLRPEYVACHHTGSTIDIDRVLIDGRSDLPGPLCSFALHADGTVVLIASGLANHCGVATISSTQAYGIEATGPIPLTASAVTAFPQYQEYVTLCAAIRLHHGWENYRVLGHKEIARPDGRKPDPAFGSRAPAPYPDMTAFRAAVDRRVRTWGLEEDDLPFTRDEIKAMVREVLNEGTGGGQTSWATTSKNTLRVAQETYNEAKAASDKAAANGTRIVAIESDVDHLVEALAPPPPPPASTAQQVGP